MIRRQFHLWNILLIYHIQISFPGLALYHRHQHLSLVQTFAAFFLPNEKQ